MKRSEEWRNSFKKYIKKHKQYLILEIMPYIRRCKVCNKKFIKIDMTVKHDDDLTNYVDKYGVCYECAYWLNFIENKPEAIQITNGVCYQILPFIEYPGFSMFLGDKGKKHYFVTKEREVIKSNDVWRIGPIPERFKDKLPDTGWFCAKNVYGKLLRFNKMCNEISCLDRYKCFRFNTQLELENGPFNEVPINWTTGEEHCGYFINTDGIIDYTSPIQINQNNK